MQTTALSSTATPFSTTSFHIVTIEFMSLLSYFLTNTSLVPLYNIILTATPAPPVSTETDTGCTLTTP